MSEIAASIAVPLAIQAADDGFKMVTAAFQAAKAKHDSGTLMAEDRIALIRIMENMSILLRDQTQWIANMRPVEFGP